MTAALALPDDVPLGWQRPRHLWVPEYSTTAGPEVVELSRQAGLDLDPWQALILDGAQGETPAGYWTAFEVCEIVPRQNGKGGVIEARELGGLFHFNEELILHSAHEFKTAQEAFRRIRFLIENTPDLDKRVARISTSHGDEGIELKPLPTIITGCDARSVRRGKAGRLRFVARTGGSGRGFSGDCVILDEAFNLPSSVTTALLPTLSARKNPQLWYASSPVNKEEHLHGLTLAKVRARGRAKNDPALAYYEWCADEERYAIDPKATAADPQEWAAANPGKEIRITQLHIEREHRAMDAKGFAVERLGIGDWPDTEEEQHLIDPAAWGECADPESSIEGRMLLTVDATPSRSHGAIIIAGWRPDDGLPHGELEQLSASLRGTGWMLKRIVALCLRWQPMVIVLDPSSAAGSLIPDLEAALGPDGELGHLDTELELISGQEMAHACGYTYDLIMEHKGCRHLDQPMLNAAVAGAKKRPIGNAWGLDRKDPTINIAPFVAFSMAMHSLAKHIDDDEGPPNLWI